MYQVKDLGLFGSCLLCNRTTYSNTDIQSIGRLNKALDVCAYAKKNNKNFDIWGNCLIHFMVEH